MQKFSFLLIAVGLLSVSITNAFQISTSQYPTARQSRAEIVQIKNTLLLPRDQNLQLVHIWLATAVFFFLLEAVSWRLYAFSGGVAAVLLIVIVSLARSSTITPLQIIGWATLSTSIRLFLPHWIRAHNDELRDRRKVAREGVPEKKISS